MKRLIAGTVGRAKLLTEEFAAWYRENCLSVTKDGDVREKCMRIMSVSGRMAEEEKKSNDSEKIYYANKIWDTLYDVISHGSWDSKDYITRCIENNLQAIEEYREYLDRTGSLWEFYGSTAGMAWIGYQGFSFWVPEQFCRISMYEDYSILPARELKLLKGGTDASGAQNAISLSDEMSLSDGARKLEELRQNACAETEKIKKLQEEQKEELERIRKEIEAKYADKISVIEEKKQKMESKVRQMEHEIFLLETEIYSIRCYMGETVNFTKLRSGFMAERERPLYVFQKMRFLDVELGKALSIYDFDGSDTDLYYFEDILRAREDLAELFCPEEKCVTVIRVSETGKMVVPDQRFANVMRKAEKFHGGQVGILLRNGQTYWLGWTDMEKIAVRDGNVFFRPHDETYTESKENIKSSTKEEVASRYFIFSLLQGLLKRNDMIQVEGEADIFHPGKNIVFSMADGWIEDQRFGTFREIMERCNDQSLIKKEDNILCCQNLRAEQPSGYSSWSNDRGRGNRNRTWDVSARDAVIYRVNLVEKETEVSDGVRAEHKFIDSWDFIRHSGITLDEWKKEYGGRGDWRNPEEYHEEKEIVHVFISLEKDDNRWRYWRDGREHKIGRANFELYPEEYINLTFLNSVWVQYAILNRKIGAFRIGGVKVDFAEGVRYLNIALSFLKKREEEEKALIETFMPVWEDWQVDLSEWKLANNVHHFTEYQCRRFLKGRK